MAKGYMPQRGGGNMAQLLKQAQKMQEEMAKQQAELETKEYVGSAGGGAVKITISGAKKVISTVIDPDILDDVEMLCDMVTAAMNEALSTCESDAASTMGALTGGMKLPGM